MSLERRDELAEAIMAEQPSLRGFVQSRPDDLMSGSWDLTSYSYQCGFEALWDLARAGQSGALQRPLLSLWRQSIELDIKAALLETAGEITGKPGHNLEALFAQLLRARREAGCDDDDDLTRNVEAMIMIAQSFDPFGDRFRYPSAKGGKPFEGIDVDLDELFQAHWIVTTWCEGGVIELKGDV